MPRVLERATETIESAESGKEEADETVRSRAGRERCPECAGDLREASERGETVCTECGLVVHEDGIDHGPEWRAFDGRERADRSRVGAPLTRTLHDEGLLTTIDWRDEDAHGRALEPEKRAQVERLRRWQRRLRTSRAGERSAVRRLPAGERAPKPRRDHGNLQGRP